MSLYRFVPALALVGVLLTAGCDDPPRSPLAPAPVTSGSETYVSGQVVDTVWRPVPAALVEIVTGPLAGTHRTADADGRFDFTSRSAAQSTVVLSVSKDGFETTSSAATWQSDRDRRLFVTQLHPLDPPLALGGGDYTLTVSFDVATALGFPPIPSRPEISCSGFPEELTSRTYEATIVERPQGRRDVRIKGPTVDPFASTFLMSVAGDVAAVDMEWFIGETFPENRYLFIGGGAVPRQFTVDSDVVRVPFEAGFRYCELSSARGIYNDCSQVPLERVVHQRWCRSDRVMLTFVPR